MTNSCRAPKAFVFDLDAEIVGNEASADATPPEGKRRLTFNEVVSRGDYVMNDRAGLELWEGPAGFQAGSFIKAIYRTVCQATAQTSKPKAKRHVAGATNTMTPHPVTPSVSEPSQPILIPAAPLGDAE